jgi:formylglycine-generating enzyme
MSHPSRAREFTEPRLVLIPGGSFLMGTDAASLPASCTDRIQDNERPAHRVFIDSFYLAATQVTRGEYAQFLAETGRAAPPYWSDAAFADPAQPVVAPSWFDAVAYCEWLSALAGHPYRLPTEAEWERAARGGLEQQLYPWGDAPLESLVNYASRWKTGPEPVGRGEANGFGLFDIGANVHEWCADWFDASYYSLSPERNPAGPASGTRRSSRGGSWRHFNKVARCSARSSIPPEFHYADYGFRVAASVLVDGEQKEIG